MNATVTAVTPNPYLAGFHDRPTALARHYARRCGDPRARDTWERAIVVASTELGDRRSDTTVAGLLGCVGHLVATVRRELERRGVLAPRTAGERIRRPETPEARRPSPMAEPAPGFEWLAHTAEAGAADRRVAEARRAAIVAEKSAGIVGSVHHRRRPEPPPEDEAERLRALNRLQVREYLREWRRTRRRVAVEAEAEPRKAVA